MALELSPEISVIIPVYKAEKHLKQCIESVLSQTYQNYELILIDDGSPDNCGVICNEYAKKDCRIKVIHKENGGVSSARNVGIEKATGKYIMFIDSDDCIVDSFLMHAFSIVERNNVDLYISGIQMDYYLDDSVYKSEKYTFLKTKEYEPLQLLLAEGNEYPSICICGPCCKLYRSEILRNHNIRFDLNMSLGEDTIFNLEFIERCNSIYCDKNIYYLYRRGNSESLFSRFSPNIFSIHEAVLEKKISVLSFFGASDVVLSNLKDSKCSIVAITAIHYYKNSRHNTNKQRWSILKTLSKKLSEIKITSRGLSKKEAIIVYLLHYKCFWLLDIILTIKYIIL